MKIKLISLSVLFILFLLPQVSLADFIEDFENHDFKSRGWYDNTNPVLTSDESAPNSTTSVKFHFPSGAKNTINGSAMRKKFPKSNSVYVRYYVKYSNNWQGSNRDYHPHEFYILTNKDATWSGLANTHLTAYIEQNDLHPKLVIQDSQNIDTNNIGVDLVNKTEKRSVAGCNGDSAGHGSGDCYSVGDRNYRNGKAWISNDSIIVPGEWHKIEVVFKLNSIVNGKGKANGVMRYWLDGKLVINHNDVMFRTGQHPDMKFNQFIIAPWIGDGSPIDQTFWVDNLILSTNIPKRKQINQLSPPTLLLLESDNPRTEQKFDK